MVEADPQSTGARWRVLLILAVSLAVAGCSSPARLTAKVTPCSTKEVQIQSSEFSRTGSTTAWCAECKGKLYQCATNPDRTRVECHVARVDDICK
jgi:starvation-inducible outer membrane lipoprotein